MHALIRRLRAFLALLLMLALPVSMTLLTPAAANADGEAQWVAWGLDVSFTPTGIVAMYTVYAAGEIVAGTTEVLEQKTTDISATCITLGDPLVIDNHAEFDGDDAFRCEVPAFKDEVRRLDAAHRPPPDMLRNDHTCAAGEAPLFGAAHVVLEGETTAHRHVIFEAERHEISLAMQTSAGGGATVRTELALQQNVYRSAPWTTDSDGNQTLMGLDGDGIVVAANAFSWLTFLQDPGWETFFNDSVAGDVVGHWGETDNIGSSSADMAVANYTLHTDVDYVFIGHSPSTGDFLKGTLHRAIVDPGCGMG